LWPRNQTFWGEAHLMRSAVGNGLCRFVIGISCRTMLGCGPQMCSDVADDAYIDIERHMAAAMARD